MKNRIIFYSIFALIVCAALATYYHLQVQLGNMSSLTWWDVKKYTMQNKGLPIEYMGRYTQPQQEAMIKKAELLRDAVQRGDVAEIKKIIKSGVVIDLPATHRDELSALHIAAMNNQVEACKVLLDAGATPAITGKRGFGSNTVVGMDTDGIQPVDYAVANPKLLEIFLDAGAPVETPRIYSMTLIQLAVCQNCPESVELLAKRGANLNSAFEVVKDVEMLELLLKLGAKPSQADVNNIGARSPNKEELRKCLEKHGYTPSLNSLLREAIGRHDLQAVQDLLNRGADPNARSSKSLSTPLHDAVDIGDVDIVNILIKAGADVNAQDIKKDTPLMLLACKMSQIDVAKALLEAGADPTIKNKWGANPIQAAKKYRFTAMYKLFNEYNKKKQEEKKSTNQ